MGLVGTDSRNRLSKKLSSIEKDEIFVSMNSKLLPIDYIKGFSFNITFYITGNDLRVHWLKYDNNNEYKLVLGFLYIFTYCFLSVLPLIYNSVILITHNSLLIFYHFKSSFSILWEHWPSLFHCYPSFYPEFHSISLLFFYLFWSTYLWVAFLKTMPMFKVSLSFLCTNA